MVVPQIFVYSKNHVDIREKALFLRRKRRKITQRIDQSFIYSSRGISIEIKSSNLNKSLISRNRDLSTNVSSKWVKPISCRRCCLRLFVIGRIKHRKGFWNVISISGSRLEEKWGSWILLKNTTHCSWSTTKSKTKTTGKD